MNQQVINVFYTEPLRPAFYLVAQDQIYLYCLKLLFCRIKIVCG